MKVLVKEGSTLLECECPVDSCDVCTLRFKCYTSKPPLTDLTLAEKLLLTKVKPIIKIQMPFEG